MFHIVVGADADRPYVLLRTDDMFQRRDEFLRQAPMRYQNQTDHSVILPLNPAPNAQILRAFPSHLRRRASLLSPGFLQVPMRQPGGPTILP